MHQMLFEMARGNFSSRIPLSAYDDELETLVVLVNMVAEELRESAFHRGMVNSRAGQGMVTSASFILDSEFRIEEVSSGALRILGYSEAEMLDRDIKDFLVLEKTQEMTQQEQAVSLERRLAGETFPLRFVKHGMLTVGTECTISKLSGGNRTVLNFIAPFLRTEGKAGRALEDSSDRLPRRTDARLIQSVYDYILAHLDESLPSLKVLARTFGTNEFKLKEGFRFFFGTSIYHFYTEERLKRAYLMISSTNTPLKSIAQENGFNSYPNFSKSFKRHFGMSPNEVPRMP